MSQHSKAPWSVMTTDQGLALYIVSDNECIAAVHDSARTKAERTQNNANAALISVAPELLDALEQAVLMIASYASGEMVSLEDEANLTMNALELIQKAKSL